MSRKGVGLGPGPGRKSARGGWSRAGWGQASARLSVKWTRRAAQRDRLTTRPALAPGVAVHPTPLFSCPAAPSGGPLGRGTPDLYQEVQASSEPVSTRLHLSTQPPTVARAQSKNNLGFWGVAHATGPGLNSQQQGHLIKRSSFGLKIIVLKFYCGKIYVIKYILPTTVKRTVQWH